MALLEAAGECGPVKGVWRRPDRTALPRLSESFLTAVPFPHIVLDRLFDAGFLESILREAENLPDAGWSPHYTRLQSKRVLNRVRQMPPTMRSYFHLVHSGDFLQFLSDISGLPHLSPDGDLFGGGLHEADGNGHFEVHVDFQKHPVTKMKNALVAITYLNRDWQRGQGGELELWNHRTRTADMSVPPLFGRTLIMSQSSIALHGYPHPLKTGTRRALISYYYVAGEREGSGVTHYLKRPGLPLDRRIQMIARDCLPRHLVTTLRRLRSHMVDRWRRRERKRSVGNLSRTDKMGCPDNEVP